MSREVLDFRMPGDTGTEETEELVEYVRIYPSRQVQILLREGTGYTNERRRAYLNWAYGGPLTRCPLDLNDNLLPFNETGRADLAPITRKEFEAAWMKSFAFLNKRRRGPYGWTIPVE